MTSEALFERVRAMEVRLEILERNQETTTGDLKEVTRDLRDLSQEIRIGIVELRGAIAKPIDKLSFGWRIIVGAGSLGLGIVMFLGACFGILSYFRTGHLPH